MAPLAEALHGKHRVLAVDLPGHGHSPDADWDWDAVLAALDDVVRTTGLGAPIVVGHSLGGMLATLWADAHPDCPLAVSLDGNPPPSGPGQLPGLADADAEFARLQTTFDALSAAMAQPLPDELRAMLGPRGVVERDGKPFMRTNPTLVAQLRQAMTELDLTPVYAGVRVPLLLVLATEDLPDQLPFHDLYAAHRAYLRAQLADAARCNPLLTVAPLAGATHAMALDRADEIAELIATFLGARA
jgi:pimeloyl-ACP methyl ester carboxylesterase